MLAQRLSKVAAAIASPLIACAFALAPSSEARAEDPPAACQDEAGLALLASPIAPWSGAPLRVVFTVEKPADGELALIAPDGTLAARSDQRLGGPPYFWLAKIASPAAGTWQAKLTRANASPECKEVTRDIVVARKQPAKPGAAKGVWPLRDAWTRETENLYAAWIEKLFDAPLDQELSWKAMDKVLHDQSRNILFNHLGLREDEKGAIIQPDCADVPYFLRAYFAFKLGLPFGYSKCTRGDGGNAPKCVQWWNTVKEEPAETVIETVVTARGRPADRNGFFGMFAGPGAEARTVRRTVSVPRRPKALVPGFQFYLGSTIANAVHSGNGRTAADDDNTDYYLVPLSEDALRPGTIYADPYGHVLILVKRLPQTSDHAGLFLAVDGQPDGTVARKRFWRGNFLFAQDPALGSPGFKRFRPIVREKNGSLRRLSNEEIAANAEYGDYSTEQANLQVEDFYDRMDDVMSPAPLDPNRALIEAVSALEEQVKARVKSVENGRQYLVGGGKNVDMPDGASIFETTGAWEDFATPSRDLRLLIAIDVVRGFPDRVARRPERYAMPKGKSAADVTAELQQVLATELAARKFSYKRTDDSDWTLTLKDVLDRAPDLEMAYNINDCAEARWGAPETSDEAATCKRRASAAQQKKMSEYRAWFSERRRPPRG
jgi:hypothetical protein